MSTFFKLLVGRYGTGEGKTEHTSFCDLQPSSELDAFCAHTTTHIPVAIRSAIPFVASMTPEHAPGEQDIWVLEPTIADVIVDCEQGADVGAHISTT